MQVLVRLMLLFISFWDLHCVQLTQSALEIGKPGQSLRLSCQVSGYSLTDSSYATHWIRQPPGKGLEWLGHSYTTGNSYVPSVQGQFTISTDSSSTVYLQMTHTNTRDSYCIFECDYNAFEYWGKGTMVTVTSAQINPPLASVLWPCGVNLETTSPVTLGCLVEESYSGQATVYWSKDGQKLTTDIKMYPSVEDSGKYKKTSTLTVTKYDSYTCVANDRSSNENSTASSPKPQAPQAPNVSILTSPNMSPPNLVCVVSDFYPQTVTISWKKGKTSLDAQAAGIIERSPVKKPSTELFTAMSLLPVTAYDWDKDTIYTCSVHHAKTGTQKELSTSKSRECISFFPTVGSTSIFVTLHPPKVKELFLNNLAVLVCEVNGKEAANVEISWFVDSQKQSQNVKTSGDNNQRTSTLTTPQENWFSGKKFECKVSHSSIQPIIKHAQVLIDKNLKKPVVNIQKPNDNRVGNSNTVNLTCVVSGFYPDDIYIMWKESDKQGSTTSDREDDLTSKPVKQPNDESYTAFSQLTVRKEEWNEKKYTCAVKHASLGNNSQSPELDSITKDDEEILEFLDFGDTNPNDGEGNAWTTALWFIFLFLFNFLYSAILTISKKQ
uniref:Ig-like domain-containing protein n=1 Tax=Lepisosteus oculatus TaxID=7918 RepID=W5LWT9_LEPOC